MPGEIYRGSVCCVTFVWFIYTLSCTPGEIFHGSACCVLPSYDSSTLCLAYQVKFVMDQYAVCYLRMIHLHCVLHSWWDVFVGGQCAVTFLDVIYSMLCVGSKIYHRTSVCSVTLCLACQLRCIAGGQYAVSPSYDSSTLCLACQARCITGGQYAVSPS